MSSHRRGQGSASKPKQQPKAKGKKKPAIAASRNTNLNPFEQHENDYGSPLTPPANSYVAVPVLQRGHGHISKELSNMDPFEVRIRFTQQLASLNASVTGASKTAQYALKYRDLDEDLHSCILEQLERSGNSMNNRANIMYFIEHLCDMAARENHYDYIRMMQRDILRMVDAVAPEDGSGAANVKVVRKVLQALQTKSFLLAQTVSEIEELLKERDTLPDNIGLSSPLDPSTPLAPNSTSKSKMAAPQRLDKKQIETRIEEDRERHKRLRENIWAIPKAVPGNTFNGGVGAAGDEFDKLWDETSDLGEDDLELYREEGEERSKAGEGWTEEFAKMHAPAE
ncbi:hypothetical protein ACEPPN_010198 [Leptodophora sp. 'Broadleaf-Isolate-01']